MVEIEYIEIDPVSRKILSPAGMLLGVMEDADSERKYFKCPKIVGDNVDLSQHQIYIKYIQSDEKGTNFKWEKPGIYHCDDVNDEGDYITFSWKLSGNVFLEKGFIAFSMFASDGDVVRWGTTTAVGTVLLTIPGGLEEVAERYPDIISQLLNRMDEVESIATPEAMQGYVNEYLDENPVTGSGGGLSDTATSLLISILRNAIYESDQSAIITALETALKEGGSSGGNTGGNEPDVPVDPDKTYYSVFVTKTNCTVNSSTTSIEEGGVYVAEIIPNDGYTIETVTVTMGGKDITSTAYSDGSISISNVTGEIVVVATAIETPNDLVYSANWNYGKRQYSPTASQDNASWTSSDWIDVTEGQVITATLLESNVIDGTTYNWSGTNTPFDVWFRDSSGSGVSPTVTPSNYMNLNNETYPSSQEVTVPDGAVSMCFCLASGRAYFNSTTTVNVSCESLEGRPVWFSLVLSGGEA